MAGRSCRSGATCRLATSVVEQGRQILAVQFQDAPQPYVQVVPKGTTLRAFYVTERGDAFVDLSGDVVSAHPGGSLTELLTVYAIVNAITTNLPAVQRVQILVEGKEVDTIAGHVDVRRPLERDSTLVRDSKQIRNSKLKTQNSNRLQARRLHVTSHVTNRGDARRGGFFRH